MEILLQLTLVTASVGIAATLLRRVSRRSRRSIEAGAVSPRWLVEHRVRPRGWQSDE
jgi:hypothetical protein